MFADAIYNKGAALDKCWGFVDETVCPLCRPKENQRAVYNSHKRFHTLKVLSVVAPNELIANLIGPLEVRPHDRFAGNVRTLGSIGRTCLQT